jgi:hypothetical protein
MKTIRPIFKVAGIIFLMYFHLLLVTAIAYKANHVQNLPVDKCHEKAIGLSTGDGALQNLVTDSLVASEVAIAPVEEPEPDSNIEEWMLNPGYLGSELEPAASIEGWMLDEDYLKAETEPLLCIEEWMLHIHFR